MIGYLVLFNFSDSIVKVRVTLEDALGKYREVFNDDRIFVKKDTYFTLNPWAFSILEKKGQGTRDQDR